MTRRGEESEARYRAAIAAFRDVTVPAGDAPPEFADVLLAARERSAAAREAHEEHGRVRWLRVAPVLLAAAAVAGLVVAGPGWLLGDGAGAETGLTASQVHGAVAVSGDGGHARPLWRSDYVRPGDRIETAAGATTVLSDELVARVILSPDTRVRVDAWSAAESLLVLESGSLTADVVSRQPGEQFAVVTPCGRVDVVGTVFAVSHVPGSTSVVAHEGVVAVSGTDGDTVARLTAGAAITLGPEGCSDAPLAVGSVAAEPAALADARDAAEAAQGDDSSEETDSAATLEAAVISGERHTAEALVADGLIGPVTSIATSWVVRAVDPPAKDSRSVRPTAELLVGAPRAKTEQLPAGMAMDVAAGVAGSRDISPSPPQHPSDSPRRARPALDAGAEPASPLAEVSAEPIASDEPTAAVAGEAEAEAEAEPTPAQAALAAYRSARGLLASGDDGAAIALLEAAVAEPGPERGRLLALLGDARRLAGQLQAARRAYEAAAEEDGAAAENAAVDLATLLQEQLGDAGAARAAWGRYLARHPHGRHASQALLARARLATAAGDRDAALDDLRRILSDHPRAREANHALVLLGEALLAARDWDAAEALFTPLADARGRRGEQALVGLLRVRIGQSRPEEARRLAAEYTERFPDGAHQAAVDALLERLGGERSP